MSLFRRAGSDGVAIGSYVSRIWLVDIVESRSKWPGMAEGVFERPVAVVDSNVGSPSCRRR
jgi:hypothetical protein